MTLDVLSLLGFLEGGRVTWGKKEVGAGDGRSTCAARTNGTPSMFTTSSHAPRMAAQVIGADSPQAMSTLFGNIARRLSAAREARLRKGKPEKVRRRGGCFG